MSEQEVYPLAVLIDELKHDDVPTRVEAMKRLPTVALALGEERTRSEMMPFLNDVAKEDEDEILTLLAEQLGDFTDYLGGVQYAHLLLEPLATLAVCEEPVVRDTALESLRQIATLLSDQHLLEHFVPLVVELSQSEWFSSRIAAAGLFPVTLRAIVKSDASNSSPIIADLLTTFGKLIGDDAPMVRRAAATNFPDVINAVPSQIDADKVMPMFVALTQDAQDSVKLLSVDVAIALCNAQPQTLVPPVEPHIFDLLDDYSWRVRYQAADRFAKLAEAVALNDEVAQRTHEQRIALFINLTNDNEAEVRTAISKQVVDYSEMLTSEEVMEKIVPSLETLTNDSSESVREALAGKIALLSPKLGNEKTVQYLLPLFLQMLRDEHSEVRLQIISHLDVINEVIGIDKLSESLLPAISDLAKDKQWRVLLAVIEYSPLLAKQLGVDFFNKELVPLVLNWLWDPVWAIRNAAAQNLTALADVFGIEWLEAEIVPKLVGVNPNANYLYRLTALLAVKQIVSSLTPNAIATQVLPFVIELSDDPVPNVRFNCASTFARIATRISPEKGDLVKHEITPILEKLTEDNDTDVRFFANEALRTVNA